MTHYGVCPLVCPLNIWPGQGFYVELFLIVASPSGYLSKQKRVFSWCFHWKNIQLDALLHNFRGLQKNSSINLCIFNFINFPLILYWERRSFPWLLVSLYLSLYLYKYLFEMLEKNHSNYDWILCPNMSNSIVLLLTLALKNKELHFWQAIVKKDEEYIGFTSRPLKAIAWDNMFYLDIALVLEERYKVWTP